MADRLSRHYFDLICTKCSAPVAKRQDQLKTWSRMCRSCSMKEMSKRPEIKEVHVKNGLAFIERYGRYFLSETKEKTRVKVDKKPYIDRVKPEDRKLRSTGKMVNWSKTVKTLANSRCQICDIRTSRLEADHILPLSVCPEVSLLLENGRALCRSCHRAYGAKVLKGEIIKPSYSPVEKPIWRIG